MQPGDLIVLSKGIVVHMTDATVGVMPAQSRALYIAEEKLEEWPWRKHHIFCNGRIWMHWCYRYEDELTFEVVSATDG